MVKMSFRIWFTGLMEMRHFPESKIGMSNGKWGIFAEVEEDNVFMDKNILMQSSGLFDHEGKEIFDGDVMEGETAKGTTSRYLVIFKDGAFVAHVSNSGEPMSWTIPLSTVCRQGVRRKIIGNIFQNPELNLWGEKVLGVF